MRGRRWGPSASKKFFRLPSALRDAGIGTYELARLAERRPSLVVTDEARDLLAAEGYDPDFGARPLKRVIQRRIEDPLALAVLEGVYSEGDTVTVGALEGVLTFS